MALWKAKVTVQRTKDEHLIVTVEADEEDTRSDAGAVVLLDRRAVTKPYGARILDGLPPAASVVGRWDEVRRRCEEFFAEHGIGAPVS